MPGFDRRDQMDKSNFTITELSAVPDVKLKAAGYIIYDTAGQFEKVLNDSFQNEPESLTVDMENVVVFTSVGIRVILKALKTAKKKGIEFNIENPSDTVRSVLKLSNLDKMLVK